MRTLTTQDKWQTWKGIILQAAALALLLTAGSFLQRNLGAIGLLLSELLFLFLAIGYTLAQKTPLREVFPLRRPSIRDIFGVIFLWGGGLVFGLLSIYAMAVILPDHFMKVLKGINGALSGYNPVLMFFIVAIAAPICEESIERGAILSHFRSWKHKWAVIVVIGIFFGIMHTDAIRFFNTAVMGGVCAYLMIKKDNFVLPVMLHFVNNSFSELISFAKGDSINIEDTLELMENMDMSMALGASMIVFFAAPFAFAVGIHLMQDKLAKDATIQQRKERSALLQKIYITAAVVSCLLLIGGAVILVTVQ